MKKNKIIISGLIATGLVLLCFLLPFSFVKDGSEVYDVIYFGDSIVAGKQNEANIADMLTAKSGLTVYNGAFGGLTVSLSVDADYISNPYTMVTMARLSESVRNRNFTLTSLASRRASERQVLYWGEKASGFKNIDLKQVKYVIIEQGANDYLSGVLLDNSENHYDISTFGGALRYSIRNIKKGIPDANIIVESPIYTSLDYANYGGEDNTSIVEYVELEKEIADEMGVYFFNAYELSGINEQNAQDYLSDGLHPNMAGADKLSDALVAFIGNME